MAERKLKIGIMGLAAWPLPMEQGKISAPQFVINNLVTKLKEMGHDIVFFGGKDSEVEVEIVSGDLYSADHDFGPEIENPVSFSERKIEYDMILAKEAEKAFNQQKIEIFNSHDIRFSPHILANSKLPVMYTPHYNLETRFTDYDQYRYNLMKNSKNLMAANISSKNNHFCKNLGLKVCGLVPNGIDTNKFPYNDSKKRDGLLLIGRMVPGKKIKEAIEIAEHIKQKITLIGPVGAKDNEKAYFNELQKSYLKRDHVNYIGPKFGQELVSYYQSAKVMLYPSETEGLPLGILEAMSTGLAVVASNVGGIPDIIDEGKDGFLINNFDSDEWGKKIELAKNIDPKLCRDKIVNKFSIEKMAENYLDAYRKCLEITGGKNV